MDPKIRNWVNEYRSRLLPKLTVEDLIRDHNHEIWRKCPKCGHEEDLRKSFDCSNCGTTIYISQNKYKQSDTGDFRST